mgnify:CR=1 FL=1
MDIHYIFGVAAGVLTFSAIFFYLFSIIKKETKPNRASWVIWNITNVILFASYFSVGARSTLFLPLVYVLSGSSTLILSFWYSEKSSFSRIDILSLFVCGLSLIVWFVTKNPLTALLMVLAMDAVCYLPTIRKSYIDPLSESHIYWVLIFLGSLANMFAIDSLSFGIIIHPSVIVVMNGALVFALYRKKILFWYTK